MAAVRSLGGMIRPSSSSSSSSSHQLFNRFYFLTCTDYFRILFFYLPDCLFHTKCATSAKKNPTRNLSRCFPTPVVRVSNKMAASSFVTDKKKRGELCTTSSAKKHVPPERVFEKNPHPNKHKVWRAGKWIVWHPWFLLYNDNHFNARNKIRMEKL